MDINRLKDATLLAEAEKPRRLEILDPVSEEFEGVVLYILGLDSKAFSNAQKDYMDALGKEDITDEEQVAAAALLYSRVVVGWEGLEDEGEEWPYTPDNAALLLKEASSIQVQVAQACTSRKHFFGLAEMD